MAGLLQDINLGKNIQKLRKKKGMTQEQVCAQLSIRGRPMIQPVYAGIEAGTRNIFVSDLIALKDLFDTTYDEFFRDLVPLNKRIQRAEGTDE